MVLPQMLYPHILKKSLKKKNERKQENLEVEQYTQVPKENYL